MEKEFNVEVITSGTFEDQGYSVVTTVIRLNSVAMNEWIFSNLLNDFLYYWENKVLERLGISKTKVCNLSITQSVNEIFTIVYMEPLKSYYFTFGSDPLYPFQNTYLIVKAKSKREAIAKFRARHKDRVEGIYNAAFCYGIAEWEGSDNQKYYPKNPAEIIL